MFNRVNLVKVLDIKVVNQIRKLQGSLFHIVWQTIMDDVVGCSG